MIKKKRKKEERNKEKKVRSIGSRIFSLTSSLVSLHLCVFWNPVILIVIYVLSLHLAGELFNCSGCVLFIVTWQQQDGVDFALPFTDCVTSSF